MVVKTADDTWRQIVVRRKEMKDEPDEMMTLEDFFSEGRGGGCGWRGWG